MARKLSVLEAKQRAGRFCALSERSPQEVIEKILGWGLTIQDAEEIVRVLSESGFVNEQRFANAFCNDKFEFNSWGRQKIKSSIYRHKLSSEVIEEALKRIDASRYQSRLKQLAKKKWDSLQRVEDFEKKQKVASYLANKGFELDLIWNAIETLSVKGH